MVTKIVSMIWENSVEVELDSEGGGGGSSVVRGSSVVVAEASGPDPDPVSEEREGIDSPGVDSGSAGVVGSGSGSVTGGGVSVAGGLASVGVVGTGTGVGSSGGGACVFVSTGGGACVFVSTGAVGTSVAACSASVGPNTNVGVSIVMSSCRRSRRRLLRCRTENVWL